MQALFDEVVSLDARCYNNLHLSEDLLMEHAAGGIAEYIKKNFPPQTSILFVSGSGNNGADVIAAARILHQDYKVSLFYAKKPKSAMALLQEKRAKAVGVCIVEEFEGYEVVVDGLVGTGFNGVFSSDLLDLMEQINTLDAFKIACDLPSGLQERGTCAEGTFRADVTLTMGALKKRMFLDEAKEFVGKIEVIDLGVSRSIYEQETNSYLLQESDLKLPLRTQQNTHKGSYGHLAIASGEKQGASILAGLAAFRFGTGLVSLIGFEDLSPPEILMYTHELPSTTTALALGMGLGEEFSDDELREFLDNQLPLIADADVFHMPLIVELLKRQRLVLTPHPKEFCALLEKTELAKIDVASLQKDRFRYVELFAKNFPHVTLLLKGANVIIAQGAHSFINPYGDALLAKGGSGDVLSGLIGALLAQGYSDLDATVNASLSHTKLAQNYKGNDFSLTPYDLIDGIKEL